MLQNTGLWGLALVIGFATAFTVKEPKVGCSTYPVVANNSALSQTFPLVLDLLRDWGEEVPMCVIPEAATGLKILLLNYSAYDSAYAEKMRTILARQIPSAELQTFWRGTPQQLAAQLSQCQLVVVPYPAYDRERMARTYGRVLRQYVMKGGNVIFCGTDKFGILQQYNLFDLDFGYFCNAIEVHEDEKEHPLFRQTPEDFVLANYVYPLDVSDPAYVSLANTRGYSTIGYKPLNAGKIVYIGIEYYYDEPIATQILTNTICWLSSLDCDTNNTSIDPFNPTEIENGLLGMRSPRRAEEYLYAGTGAVNTVDLKIYPNPYIEKAFLEFALDKPSSTAIEMVNETGNRVAVLLPTRSLNAGQYRVEIPNLSPGVYFIKCQIGNQTVTRKVIKKSA